jgi:diguanylate cyclase (GGDEF)-like protein
MNNATFNFELKCVLIAEDDFLVAQEVEYLLTQLGCQRTIVVSNGLEAVRQAREIRPSAIIMDLTMPEMDGLEATRAIQQETPTPIVVLTAHDSHEDLIRAAEAGVGGYLTKPPVAVELERSLIIATARHYDWEQLDKLKKELSTKNRQMAIENKHLKEEVRTDELTGAFSRRHGMALVKDELQRLKRYNIPFAVLMIDVDNFKDVNDKHGHLAGDKTLCSAVKLLNQNVRELDRLIRYGGDEFLLLLPSTDAQGLQQMCERLCNLNMTCSWEDSPVGEISFTIGGTLARRQDDVSSLIRRADYAMFHEKHLGKGGYYLDLGSDA